MILPGIEPGSPDYMFGALTHSAIESSTFTRDNISLGDRLGAGDVIFSAYRITSLFPFDQRFIGI